MGCCVARSVLMKWTQPSSHTSLTRGTMGAVERATHTHCPNEGRGCYGHYDIGDRCGEERVPVARGGCARACGAQPACETQSVDGHGGKSAALCDRDGSLRDCASLALPGSLLDFALHALPRRSFTALIVSLT